MTKFIFIVTFLSLFGLNSYIYFNTGKKIEAYSKTPPFQIDDFTKSYRKNKSSKIKHLVDHDKSTFWIKEQDSIRSDYDIELELTLTHYYSESKFFKKQFHSLVFQSCENGKIGNSLRNPNKMQVVVFLREAINIDKELRLPKDTKIKTFELDFKNSDSVIIDISTIFDLKESHTFPENIFIVTLLIKDKSIHDNSGKTCLAGIEIE